MSAVGMPAEGVTVRVPGYAPTKLLRGWVTWTKGYPFADVDAVYKGWESIDDYATAWADGPVGFHVGTTWDLPEDWPTVVVEVGLLARLWGRLTSGVWPEKTRKSPVGGRYIEKVFRLRVPAEWVSARRPGDGALTTDPRA